MLKRWERGSLALILALACFSLKSLKGITQEWRKGSERALSWLRFEFSSSKWQERGMKGYGGGIYSLQPRTSRWAKGYPETPGNPNYQPENSHSDTPGKGIRSIRPYTWSIRVWQGKTSIFALLNCFVAHKYLSRFSWALVSSQHLWIKSLLIVRRPYTQISKIKSNFMSTLEHRLFISFLRGHTSSLDSPIHIHHLHTCLITQLNIHVFCHYSPKPT